MIGDARRQRTLFPKNTLAQKHTGPKTHWPQNTTPGAIKTPGAT